MRETSFGKNFEGGNNDQEKVPLDKVGQDMSRRKFLGLTAQGVASVGLTTSLSLNIAGLLVINKQEMLDIFDNARKYGLEKDFLELFEGMTSKIESIRKKYGVEVVFRNLYKFFNHGEVIIKDLEKEGSTVKSSDIKQGQIKKIKLLEIALEDLETILEVWPQSMVRGVKKVTFRGLEEKYNHGGHVDQVKKEDMFKIDQGREINISVTEYAHVPVNFSHEMCHFSEKFFLNSGAGLDEIWEESMKMMGIEPYYLRGYDAGMDATSDEEKVPLEELIRAGYIRSYSGSWPCEDRATTLEDMFDPVASDLPKLSKMYEWENLKHEYLAKVAKKKALMQAFMYIFSCGKMDDVFFYSLDNPMNSPYQNFARVIADKKYTKANVATSYEAYKRSCYKLLCTTLDVKELPDIFLKFLAKVFSDKVSKGDWERYSSLG